MNGVPEYYELKMKMTSKGIWYCDELRISGEKWKEVLDAADPTMTDIEKLLEKHNKEAVASTEKL